MKIMKMDGTFRAVKMQEIFLCKLASKKTKKKNVFNKRSVEIKGNSSMGAIRIKPVNENKNCCKKKKKKVEEIFFDGKIKIPRCF